MILTNIIVTNYFESMSFVIYSYGLLHNMIQTRVCLDKMRTFLQRHSNLHVNVAWNFKGILDITMCCHKYF